MKAPLYRFAELDIPPWLRVLITHRNAAILDVAPELQAQGFPAQFVAPSIQSTPFSALIPIGELPPNALALAEQWAMQNILEGQQRLQSLFNQLGGHDPATCPRCRRGETVH